MTAGIRRGVLQGIKTASDGAEVPGGYRFILAGLTPSRSACSVCGIAGCLALASLIFD